MFRITVLGTSLWVTQPLFQKLTEIQRAQIRWYEGIEEDLQRKSHPPAASPASLVFVSAPCPPSLVALFSSLPTCQLATSLLPPAWFPLHLPTCSSLYLPASLLTFPALQPQQRDGISRWAGEAIQNWLVLLLLVCLKKMLLPCLHSLFGLAFAAQYSVCAQAWTNIIATFGQVSPNFLKKDFPANLVVLPGLQELISYLWLTHWADFSHLLRGHS